MRNKLLDANGKQNYGLIQEKSETKCQWNDFWCDDYKNKQDHTNTLGFQWDGKLNISVQMEENQLQ